MLNKVFVQCLFGAPFDWLAPYFEHFGRLGATGWRMKVFTPHVFPVPSNIELIPMTLAQFDALVESKSGVNPHNFMVGPAPRKLISDYYCAFGQIFEDYLRDVDFWAITNFDVVYGRLSKFLPDSELQKWDIWSDDGNAAINGTFTLFKNNAEVNSAYRHVPDWQECFTTHEPCGFDEIRMTHAVRKLSADGVLRFGYPDYFALQSYDRLVQHQPKPNLYFEADGGLVERFEDRVHFPNERGFFGREIMSFHFSRTKKWPIAV